MAKPSELDWFQAPTCSECTELLIAEQCGDGKAEQSDTGSAEGER
ncbi:hypothetical protein [Actinopolyspora mortivallis]|nr:hypothetical protein [Actinopolyspora mortivallis]